MVHQLGRLHLVVVHGALVLEEGAARVCSIGVEVVAQTLDTDTAKDAEDVALMFVELCEENVNFLFQFRLVRCRTYLGELRGKRRSDLRGETLARRSSSDASGADSC